MHHIVTLLLVTAVACGSAAPRVAPVAWPEPGGTATTGEIRGRIVDLRHAPLAGVPVMVVSDAGSATAVTEADGRYRITGLAPSMYVLTYQVGEALTARRNILVQASHAAYVVLKFDDRPYGLE